MLFLNNLAADPKIMSKNLNLTKSFKPNFKLGEYTKPISKKAKLHY